MQGTRIDSGVMLGKVAFIPRILI